ncbi:MAG: homoserine kinase [Alphaproteobacteria bacterium]|nr:MAG: homoserine kinase [Alphaproteobacteria bacterium]
MNYDKIVIGGKNMAVYTFLDDFQLDMIKAEYGLHRVIKTQPIEAGVENSNYHLFFERQEGRADRAILTIFEQRVNKENIDFYVQLKEYLHARGIPCPTPYRTLSGARFMRLGDKLIALVHFLEGASILAPSVADSAQAGSMLARMHCAGADFPLHNPNGVSFAGWEALLARIARVAPHHDLYALATQEYDYQCSHFPRDLSCGVIHADMFPNNVFFDNNGTLSGVIDFYFACNDAYAYDLAITANAWCFDAKGMWNGQAYDAMCAAYDAVRPRSHAEHAAMPILLRASAMRFLLTRLHDVLYHNPDALVIPHDPQEYADKLMLHQQMWR